MRCDNGETREGTFSRRGTRFPVRRRIRDGQKAHMRGYRFSPPPTTLAHISPRRCGASPRETPRNAMQSLFSAALREVVERCADSSLLLEGGEPAIVASRTSGKGGRVRDGVESAEADEQQRPSRPRLAPRANREIYVELCIYEYRNAYLHMKLIRVIIVIFSADERSIIVVLARKQDVCVVRIVAH